MKVLKFGGASVKNAQEARNLADIIDSLNDKNQLLVVISAMGKTTNKLEELFTLASKDKRYQDQLDELLAEHRKVSEDLIGKVSENYLRFEKSLIKSLSVVSDLPHNKGYDALISHGELMSTSIIADFLNLALPISWMDAREVIRTDQYFSEANIDWVVTERKVNALLKPMLREKIVITQGFIGADVEGNTTTLGREGSDFTGSVLAHCLNADSFSVFKDVKGILNADPRILGNTEKYDYLSYREVTEMTYYGAQVIHPKTLKPLAQKGIPLLVKSFKDKTEQGTKISEQTSDKVIPCYVFKKNQVLVNAQVKDHNFMEEKKLGLILQVLDLLNIKINLMQNSALSLSFCIDYKEFKIKRIKELLNRDFILSFENDLELATIKSYREDSFQCLPESRKIIMEQKTPDNYQVLYRLGKSAQS